MAIKEVFVLHKNNITETAASGPTASGVTGWPVEVAIGNYARAAFYLDITALSGGGTFTVNIEEYVEQADKWVLAGSFPGQTAVGTTRLTMDPLWAYLYRVNWTLTGTSPSVTFGVEAWCGSEETPGT